MDGPYEPDGGAFHLLGLPLPATPTTTPDTPTTTPDTPTKTILPLCLNRKMQIVDRKMQR